jgi:predicted ATPase
VSGKELPSTAVERIFARSEGNPFHAEELLAAGADEADVRLPETLADVLLARVEGLSPAAQELLRVAAVAGRRVSHQLLAEAAGRPELEVEGSLREAIAARVLVADPTSESYAFRHALMQEAVDGDLLPGSGCGSMQPTRVSLLGSARRLSSPITAGSAKTYPARWTPR